jgi:hypothetical protein
MQTKIKLSFDGGDCCSKKYKRGYGSAYGGVWRSLRLVGFWSQAVRFVLVRLTGICFSRREDVFTFNLLYKEIL